MATIIAIHIQVSCDDYDSVMSVLCTPIQELHFRKQLHQAPPMVSESELLGLNVFMIVDVFLFSQNNNLFI